MGRERLRQTREGSSIRIHHMSKWIDKWGGSIGARLKQREVPPHSLRAFRKKLPVKSVADHQKDLLSRSGAEFHGRRISKRSSGEPSESIREEPHGPWVHSIEHRRWACPMGDQEDQDGAPDAPIS
ncbi:hypothetical protein ASPBRDRAFT_59531 [Aspergillus brasiliensis CBS 101740]|uniref:Uncharacterized protein n=1 Tax=Aspergillus brasiliensis (strain CBS 101740 / IMI 381727 / IBT 21946) TaxID=767769 RepID=A0A1L9U4Z5_ASPBC|nr:hypothetical protein ASPBRDRAFT_59531 [Aspergillus brasiliensis CBS 101740]